MDPHNPKEILMSMSSSLSVLKPLRSAANDLHDAALAAQNDFSDGAAQARKQLQAGWNHALNDVASSNAKLQAVVDDVAAATRATAESAIKRGKDLGRSANRRFLGWRKQAISQATDALDNSVQYSRKASRKMQKAATDATSWAARNPRTVFVVAVTACCVAVLRYRRRRKALAEAAKKTDRPIKSAAARKANGARASTPKRRPSTGASATNQKRAAS
jgi:hypothetical protein